LNGPQCKQVVRSRKTGRVLFRRTEPHDPRRRHSTLYTGDRPVYEKRLYVKGLRTGRLQRARCSSSSPQMVYRAGSPDRRRPQDVSAAAATASSRPAAEGEATSRRVKLTAQLRRDDDTTTPFANRREGREARREGGRATEAEEVNGRGGSLRNGGRGKETKRGGARRKGTQRMPLRCEGAGQTMPEVTRHRPRPEVLNCEARKKGK